MDKRICAAVSFCETSMVSISASLAEDRVRGECRLYITAFAYFIMEFKEKGGKTSS